MFHAVIDTNVLVSALLNMESNPGKVLLSVFNGETVPLMNEEIMTEYRDVLAREKFHFPAELVDVILKRLAASSLSVSAPSTEFPEVGDPKDRRFYAVTMSGRDAAAAVLVTGNIRHFPVKPFVVTPAQFVAMLQAGEAHRSTPMI